jgi:hypothetical protein
MPNSAGLQMAKTLTTEGTEMHREEISVELCVLCGQIFSLADRDDFHHRGHGETLRRNDRDERRAERRKKNRAS